MRRRCGLSRLFVVSAFAAPVLLTAGIAGASPAACFDCPITINDYSSGLQDQAATPYPSNTSGIADAPPIDKATVTLAGLTHGALHDVDVLLVSPTGQAVELMSDVGGPFPAASLNLTFDDAATLALPQGVPPSSGTYRPTNYAGGPSPCVGDSPPTSGNADPFPASAPPPPAGGYSEALASLHGTFNSGFRLYVGDDCTGGTGSISSWSVNVTSIPCSDLCLIKKADAVTVEAGSSIGFTFDAYNNLFFCQSPVPEDCDIHDVILNDPLPAGPGINWSISPAYTGPGSCSITGVVGSQTLSCGFGDFPLGSGVTRVHISSSTTPALGCRTYSNTGTLSAFNAPSVQDTDSTTVTGCPTAVNLSSLAATQTKRGVLIRWRTASESGILGFTVYRTRAGKLVRVNRALIPSVPGGSSSGRAYRWLDRTVPSGSGTVEYRLQAVGLDGTRRWLGASVVSR